MEQELQRVNGQYTLAKIGYENLYTNTRLFIEVIKIAPQNVTDYLKDILLKAREEQQKAREVQLQKRKQQQLQRKGRRRYDDQGR